MVELNEQMRDLNLVNEDAYTSEPIIVEGEEEEKKPLLKRITADIGGGLKEAIPQVGFGAQEAINETIDAGEDLANWLTKNKYDFEVDYRLPEGPEPTTVTGGLVRTMSQFLTGFAGSGALMPIKIGTKLKKYGIFGKRGKEKVLSAKEYIQSAISAGIVFDPHEETFWNFLKQKVKPDHPKLYTSVINYMAVDPSDSKLEGRLKNVMTDVMFTTLLGAPIAGGLFKYINWKKKQQKAQATLDEYNETFQTIGLAGGKSIDDPNLIKKYSNKKQDKILKSTKFSEVQNVGHKWIGSAKKKIQSGEAKLEHVPTLEETLYGIKYHQKGSRYSDIIEEKHRRPIKGFQRKAVHKWWYENSLGYVSKENNDYLSHLLAQSPKNLKNALVNPNQKGHVLFGKDNIGFARESLVFEKGKQADFNLKTWEDILAIKGIDAYKPWIPGIPIDLNKLPQFLKDKYINVKGAHTIKKKVYDARSLEFDASGKPVNVEKDPFALISSKGHMKEAKLHGEESDYFVSVKFIGADGKLHDGGVFGTPKFIEEVKNIKVRETLPPKEFKLRSRKERLEEDPLSSQRIKLIGKYSDELDLDEIKQLQISKGRVIPDNVIQDKIKKLWAALPDYTTVRGAKNWKRTREAILIGLQYEGLLRPQEALSLKFSNIRIEPRPKPIKLGQPGEGVLSQEVEKIVVVDVFQSKTGKWKKVDWLSPELQKKLWKYKKDNQYSTIRYWQGKGPRPAKGRAYEYLFPPTNTKKGQPMTQAGYTKILKKVFEDTEYANVSPYWLRRSGATNLREKLRASEGMFLSEGDIEKFISTRLGHKTPKVSRLYLANTRDEFNIAYGELLDQENIILKDITGKGKRSTQREQDLSVDKEMEEIHSDPSVTKEVRKEIDLKEGRGEKITEDTVKPGMREKKESLFSQKRRAEEQLPIISKALRNLEESQTTEPITSSNYPREKRAVVFTDPVDKNIKYTISPNTVWRDIDNNIWMISPEGKILFKEVVSSTRAWFMVKDLQIGVGKKLLKKLTGTEIQKLPKQFR